MLFRSRMQELENISTRAQNFSKTATEEMERKRDAQLAPIYEKLQKAIDSVGEENGYTFIIAPQALFYKGKGVVDATDKVKAKMGLK